MKKVENYLRKLGQQNKSVETIRVYRVALNKYFNYLCECSLGENVDSVEKFLNTLEERSGATQRLYFAALKGYYKYIKRTFILRVNYQFRKKIQNEDK